MALLRIRGFDAGNASLPSIVIATRLAAFLFASAMPLLAVERTPWISSQLHGSPEPPAPYVIERAFPKLTFSEPIEAVMIPGTKRILVAGLRGKIVTFPYDDAAEQTSELVDMKQWNPEVRECFSVTFHPRFAENRFLYVWVNLDGQGKPNRADGTRIVRFRMTTEEPPRVELASAVEIFTCMSGGHNGGNLRFGPDGMLYLGLGDTEVPDPPDPKVTGQDISDVHASVLRIDVDQEEGGRHYAIPKDNPFVSTPGARGEIWAYGLRNPWRLTFSPEGELWVGDVGWELWESIVRVERGGNYGWSITEAGKQDVRPDRLRGPTPILAPAYVHSHEEAASITGGEFYAGQKLPELRGKYVYGDWQTGTFWALTRLSGGGVEVKEMCKSSLLPVSFGLGADGEVLACDQVGGGIWRFARNPEAGQPSKFPRRLSESGLFRDLAAQAPAEGVQPYTVIASRWADGAVSQRWIGLPGSAKISVAQKEHGVIARGRWEYPKDSVLAKTYSLETKPGVFRKVETQVLHFDGIQWGAYSYEWNDAQTDAELVGVRGKDALIEGQAGRQNWRFFSRAECLRCHNMWNNFTPGFSPAALDHDGQLGRLAALGVIPETPSKAPGYASDHVAMSKELHAAAREYLNANCGTCHRLGGGGSVRILLDAGTKLADMRIIDELPLQGSLGLPEARLIAPGDPARSVILQRMATGGRGHMPYLGARSVDDAGVTLIRNWIASLPATTTPASVDASRQMEKAALAKLRSSNGEALTDGQISQTLDTLLASGSGALEVALALADQSLTGKIREAAIARGAELADPLRRDLFERHLPAEKRRKVLGATFDRTALAQLPGNAARGRAHFVAACATCHRHGVDGRDFGPDLTQIGKKYPVAALIDQIAEPAKVLDPAWHLAVIEMKDGSAQSGFVSVRTDKELTLRTAEGTAVKLPVAQMAKTTMQRVSLMPEGLLGNLTAQEAADLLAFLSTP